MYKPITTLAPRVLARLFTEGVLRPTRRKTRPVKRPVLSDSSCLRRATAKRARKNAKRVKDAR